MNNFMYLDNPVEVPETDLLVVGVSPSGFPYGIRERDYSGVREYDVDAAFLLMPYLQRLAEAEQDVPEYGVVLEKVQEAKRVLGFPENS